MLSKERGLFMNHNSSGWSWASIFILSNCFFTHIVDAKEDLFLPQEGGNEVTLQAYESAMDAYIAATPAEVGGTVKTWIDQTLGLLLPNARIFEIGSGFGRDASYMESRGFTVERTDAAQSFVGFLQQNGYSARQFNALTDEFSAKYDLIYANCVFLHFTPRELEQVFHKVYDGLSNKGILAFAVKCGEGKAWSCEKIGMPRYFCYWNADKLRALVESAGFEVKFLFQDQAFIQIIAQRP